MKKSVQIEILRSVAILFVLFYHFYVLFAKEYSFSFINYFLKYGGEIGVTLFFIISGFEIYASLNNKKTSYLTFIKNRFIKLAPQYYVSLLIMILLSSSAVFLTKTGLTHVFSHMFFVHNLFYYHHGSINGVLWALGVIFQFYIFSPLLYKYLKKFKIVGVIITIAIVIISKYIIFNYLIPSNSDGFYYFIYGRQLLTALDNFIIGMFIAKLFYDERHKLIKNNIVNIILLALLIILIYFWVGMADIKGLYHVSRFAYIWHSVLAILLGLFILIFLNIKINAESKLSKLFMFIAKYEYSIYIWHFVIATNLVTNSIWIKNMTNTGNFVTFSLLMILISVVVGYLYGKVFQTINWNNIFTKVYNNFTNIIKALILIIILFFLPFVFDCLKETFSNIKNIYNNNIIVHDDLENMVKNINSIVNEKAQYKYIYLDNSKEEGYLNFYYLRYYLSPNISVYYNDYVNLINSDNYEDIYQYLSNIDVDYIIVRESNFINDITNKKVDSDKGAVFIKNKNKKHTINNFLIEIGGDK